MRKWSLMSAVGVAALLLFVRVSGQQGTPRRPFEPGELIVRFAPNANAAQRNLILATRGAGRLRRFATLDMDQVRLPPGLPVEAAVAAFQATPGVLLAQPNYTRRAIQSAPPNDPFWLDGSLWGLSKIQAPSVWAGFTAGDGSVVIADIDTGVDYTHPDLAANMWRNPLEVPANGIDDDGNGYVDDVFGIDTVNHDADPMDDEGHGSHTSGTIAAVGNNAAGVVGVTWNAKILACKFLSSAGFGTDAGAIECFDYLVAMKVRGVNIRVSSNSWGAPREAGPPATALQAAIDAAGDVGIINIFGAGNDGTNNDFAPFDPASYTSPSIVAVASSGQTDRRSGFSNYGATSVDLAAPGENILSTVPGAGYGYASGTSMATPHVAGVAALLANLNSTLSVGEIKALLLDNVDKLQRWRDIVVSGGRLNAFRAASAAGSGPMNAPPSATLTAPAAGTLYKEPATVELSADAADSDGSIVAVTFYANGTPIGSDTTSPYTMTWAQAPAGNVTLTAVATDNLGAIGASPGVAIVIEPNTPPSVAITSPLAGATFTSPASLTISADAADSDGSVVSVVFYAGGTPIGEDTTSPYSVTWPAPMGTHLLTAVATDNQGATNTSAAVAITVDPIPGRINLARATNGGAPTASSTLSPNYPASATTNGDRRGLNWGAGGGWNDGTQNASPDWLEVSFNGQKLIEEVNVFSMQDNYQTPAEPTPSMTFTYYGLRGFEVHYWDGEAWVAIPGGVVANNTLVWRRFVFAPVTTTKIRVWVTGALNGYSRIMEVEAWGVATGVNVAPNVSIASPSTGATFTVPASITVTAEASDHDGSIASVAFFADGAPIGSASAAPYSVVWPDVQTGAYTLTAVATDNLGETTTSAPVSITVGAANVPPVIAVTDPPAGAVFTAPASISVSAAATDSDGSIASVAFFGNGAPIGTVTAAPYTIPWTNVQAGSYAVTAAATDNLGATTTSAPVLVTVNPDPNRLNVALTMNGGAATASSTYNTNYPASGAINGDRRGLNWGSGGGWNDGTANTSPDWIEIAFAGPKLIDEVNVFSMQDNYASPAEPTPAMTFAFYGLRAFEVQYWTGGAWAAVPGGLVTNNNLVWRRVAFEPLTTTRIRVFITGALNGYSRVMEVEAWGAPVGNTAPEVALIAPASGAAFAAPATIGLAASASDLDGAIQQVAFFANGAPIGSDPVAPYELTWTGVAAGAYALTAVATDNVGVSTTSDPVYLTVSANTPPAVSIVTPADGAEFTAPVSIAVSASADDADGSVVSVAFFANGAPIGTAAASPFAITWANVAAGTYAITATATDNLGSTSASAPVTVTVAPPAGRMNVALASNGGVATASSIYNANYPPSGAINGDRRGLNWGAGGGWNDGTANASPDWIEVAFSGPKTIDEVSVFSMQDNYASPLEPTPTMTFAFYGLRAFEVQYWNGAAWVTVPGATVTNNTLVWRRFQFTPVTTTKIRVFITGALNGYSRVMEVEAWGVAGG